jgi:hypothetical protein
VRRSVSICLPIVLGAVALSLSACGGTTRPSTSSVPSSSVPSSTPSSAPASTAKAAGTTSTTKAKPTTTTTKAATTTTTSGQATTTTSVSGAALGRCHTSQLGARLVHTGAAAGSVGQTIAFTNNSSSACTLYGYPGLLMLNAKGQPLPTQVHRGSSATVHPEAPSTVTLDPGQSASFALGYADATGYPGQHCPASASLEVTPPNTFHQLVISDHLNPYGPCGNITVSPVYPGTGPQPGT